VRFVFLIALVTGCECASVRDDVRFRCDPGGVCPDGLACVGDYCEPASGAGGGGATAGGGAAGGSAAGGSAAGGSTAGGASGGAAGGTVDAGPSGVFVWEHPLPYGHAINAMASAGNDVYAVGDHGLILHGDTGRWVHEASNTGLDLNGVAVTPNGSYVMAVGEHGLVLQRGPAGAWQPRDAGTTQLLRAVAWSSDLSRFVSVGDGNSVLLWDLGAGPATVTGPPASGPLRSVDSAMTVVSPTEIFHRAGTSWSLTHDEGIADLFAVAGPWAAGKGGGGNGVVMSFDGGTWARISFATTGGPAYRAVTAFGGDNCAAVGEAGIAYFCGLGMRNDWPQADLDLYAVTHSAGITWAGGRSALVLRSTGGAFVEVDVGITGRRCQQLNAIGGTSAARLFAGGSRSTLLMRNANGTWSQSAATALPGTVLDIAAAPNGDVWVVGAQERGKGFLADGGEVSLSLVAMNPTAVAATATSLWIASGGQVLYANLAAPNVFNSAMVGGLPIMGLAVTGDGGVGSAFAVTQFELTRPGIGLVHTDNAAFFEDLWISPGGDIFIAGGTGLRRTTVAAPGPPNVLTTCAKSGLVAVHGTSSTDVWALEGAGRAAIQLGAGGSTCTRHPLPFNSTPTDIFVTATDVWVTGRDCAIFHLAR